MLAAIPQVVYNVDGFCDKNKDLLFKDLIGLAECTSSTFFAVRVAFLFYVYFYFPIKRYEYSS